MLKSRNVIGVACRRGEEMLAREFFELFKTPWEFYSSGCVYPAVVSTDVELKDVQSKMLVVYGSGGISNAAERAYVDYGGVTFPIYGNLRCFTTNRRPLATRGGSSEAVAVEHDQSPVRIVRVGYDLFQEIKYLLTAGQPVHNAATPTLEIHISMLRNWILSAGVPLVEIPPAPSGYDFITCLTHDVDFVRLSDHKFDHTMWGFIQRASIGSLIWAMRREIPWAHLGTNWKTLISLPAVHMKVCEDPWYRDFDRFLALERDMKSTYFFIPFRGRPGDRLDAADRYKRAAAYDVANEQPLIEKLAEAGNEIGVHGIDAWCNADKAREERKRITAVSGNRNPGVRMHWLCFDAGSPGVLEDAGFPYDASVGYNDATGYRAGTLQVFRPQGAKTLLELPLHIQDAALFYSGHTRSVERDAWKICETVVNDAQTFGGVLTVLWHTRSLAPERMWGGFYIRLLELLKSKQVWFATAAKAVDWFQYRRAVSFHCTDSPGQKQLRITVDRHTRGGTLPDLAIRIHSPNRQSRDIPWTGEPVMEVPVEELRR
jgi:hypothetical protein